TLLGDGVRVLTRIMKKITAIAGAAGTRLRDKTRTQGKILSGANSPFEHDCHKLILYSARPENDPLSVKRELERWMEKRAFATSNYKADTLETLYSSIHLITACTISVERIDGAHPLRIPVEIQFRTEMEDVWGQLSRLTGYPFQDAKPSIRKHLNVLKQLTDGCALYADLIKGEADLAIVGLEETTESPKSAGDQSLAGLKSIPADISEDFNAALKHRMAASAMEESVAGAEFLDAAEKFANIEAKLRVAGDLSDKDRAEALYRTQMERAFCLLYANNMPSLDEALALYERLAKADENDAVCRFRLGQTLRRRAKYEEARDKLLEAAQILKENRDRRVGKRNWVRGAVHLELGHAHWYISSSIEDPEKHEALKKAISEVKFAVQTYRTTDADR